MPQRKMQYVVVKFIVISQRLTPQRRVKGRCARQGGELLNQVQQFGVFQNCFKTRLAATLVGTTGLRRHP